MAPQWNSVEWQIAEAVAALQGMSSLLSHALPWQGPHRWKTFLLEQRYQCTLRHRHISELVSRIDAGARAAGIGLVALKGAALLQLNVYQIGDRPMGDIDLLVKEADLEGVAAILQTLGYRLGLAMWRHVTFEPPGTGDFTGFGEHIDNPIRIEVHTRIAERLPFSCVDITSQVLPGTLSPGLNPYPSLAALMRHLLLHAAGNLRARALRQIQLHDIASLAARLDHEDWIELLGAWDPWWLLPPLQLTTRYYATTIPQFVWSTLERACPRRLQRATARQRLSDVSWSSIRIEAFPGIEWSCSPLEALRFVGSRIVPSRSDLAVLKYSAATPSYAARIPWYGQSHLKRIARWVFNPPPRVQTMFAVRCAFGDEPRLN